MTTVKQVNAELKQLSTKVEEHSKKIKELESSSGDSTSSDKSINNEAYEKRIADLEEKVKSLSLLLETHSNIIRGMQQQSLGKFSPIQHQSGGQKFRSINK